jgi:lipoate-protein ligase A
LTNKYNFRFAFTPGWAGIMNMEADRFFGEIAPPDLPLVRFYTWDRPTISLGYNQNPVKRIDLESCRRDGIPVVQRPTGGRELLHGHDLCYSLAMPQKSLTNGVEAKRIFASVSDILIRALGRMGVEAEWKNLDKRPKARYGPCFTQVDAGEIAVGEKKLVASAQRIFELCVIQQGSIPLIGPTVDLTNYLRQGNKESLRLTLDSTTAFLSQHVERKHTIDSVVGIFREAFVEGYSSQAGPADELFRVFDGNKCRALWYY